MEYNRVCEEYMLEFVAFLCGAAVMTLEMTGSRILAPYLGSSVLVWTALIGVIMAFLSVGYWLGGKMADQSPTTKKLAAIIIAAAFSVLMIGVFHAGLLGAVSKVNFRPEMAAIIASIILFGPASLLLGMVSPYIVRVALQLRSTPVEQAGSVIGRFAALSAVGSILGTFLGGYVFISWIGSRLTIYMIASVLMSVAVLALMAGRMAARDHKILYTIPCLGLLTSILFGGMQKLIEYDEFRSGVLRTDTRYSRLEIMDGKTAGGRVMRQLYTPPNLLQSGMYLDSPDSLALSYTRHYALAWQLRPGASRFLMLGGAGYSVPKYLLGTRNDITLDVAEIDPDMTRLARQYFNLKDDPRLSVYHEDARTYLNRYAMARAASGSTASGQGGADVEGAPGYDIIMGDTFSSAYNIPFQLSTVECAEKIYASLDEDGVFISNVISAVTGEKGQLLRSLRASFEEVFPDVRVFPLAYSGNPSNVQNVMLVAFKQPQRLPTSQELKERGPDAALVATYPDLAKAELNTAAFMLQNEWLIKVAEDLPPMYDDFAPVERYALPLLY
ncbi:fused MFS/spermidine synthase [Desulfovibrio sp. OttesenSCG-928-C06]|nr:fused MFS/spermidine synthase [Desulfovibrio sp. OttesenSCG-928-C06]